MTPRQLRQEAFDAPWKVTNEMQRYLALPYIRLYFALHGVAWREGWRIYGVPLIRRYRGSRILMGDGLQMRSWFSSNPLGVVYRSNLTTWSPDAEIRIGNKVGMTGVTICAQESVYLGDRVRIGANSLIVDTDFHPIALAERLQTPTQGKSLPVVIEDDVFIGTRVIILKGAQIGEGSVVGAGSVVAGAFPSGVVIAGNPARVVRELEEV